ncbi:hypothetical protein Tco_0835827, partial [Tanacetum coccineum]
MATFEVLGELMEIIGSTELHKRMQFWFVQDIFEEEGFLKFLCDRCDDLRRRSAKRRARETDKLVALTEVLVETQAGIHEKEGHDVMDVDDIDYGMFGSWKKPSIGAEDAGFGRGNHTRDSRSQNMGDDVDINTLTMEQYLALIQ